MGGVSIFESRGALGDSCPNQRADGWVGGAPGKADGSRWESLWGGGWSADCLLRISLQKDEAGKIVRGWKTLS